MDNKSVEVQTEECYLSQSDTIHQLRSSNKLLVQRINRLERKVNKLNIALQSLRTKDNGNLCKKYFKGMFHVMKHLIIYFMIL